MNGASDRVRVRVSNSKHKALALFAYVIGQGVHDLEFYRDDLPQLLAARDAGYLDFVEVIW